MPIDKKALKKLNKELPYGSSTKIRERLIEKFGEKFEYTTAYIRAVLSPDDLRENEVILSEAILLRNELRDKRKGLESQIFDN